MNYDPETGIFKWNTRPNFMVSIGDIAGGKDKNGYRCIKINGRMYKAHRLAWLYVYGEWPANEIDHIDGNPGNNSINNLRSATRAENRQNLSIKAKNKSGIRGVYWHKQHSKWCVQIKVNHKAKHVGLFDDLQEASAAYLRAKHHLHLFQPVPRDVA